MTFWVTSASPRAKKSPSPETTPTPSSVAKKGAPNATVIQADVEAKAIGRNRPAHIAILGDARATAEALSSHLEARGHTNTGFRTDAEAHREVAEVFGREVVTLELTDPRFYHLDTALFVLHDEQIAYFPGAFSDDSRAVLRCRYPDAIIVEEQDATMFGCNAMSDGHHVFAATYAEHQKNVDAARRAGLLQ